MSRLLEQSKNDLLSGNRSNAIFTVQLQYLLHPYGSQLEGEQGGKMEKKVKVTRMFSEPHHEPSVQAQGHRARWGLAG